MELELRFSDKYRFWSALVRGNTDRLFIPTKAHLRLGDSVDVRVSIGEASLPIVVGGTVVGQRDESRRFARGVYLKISDDELEKFRRFLQLQPSRGVFDRARKAARVEHAAPVRFVEPKTSEVFRTKNISESGVFITCPEELACGQRVSLYLVLDEMPIAVQAEVVWRSKKDAVAGLRIAEIGDHAAQRLRDTVEAVRQQRNAARDVRPILVADDDDETLRFVGEVLSRKGYEVFHCSDGDATLEMLRELQPELVMMDILMPGTDGAEVCKVMRADAELAHIKVIFISALDEDVLHNVADESGATDYLVKPMDEADLVEMVEHYLG